MNPQKLKTFSHLAPGRIPNDYEIASTDLLYSRYHAPEVETPTTAWTTIFLKQSPLQCSNWEKFSDPRATTYAGYTSRQNGKEEFTARLFQSMEGTRLSPRLLKTVGALRFVFHTLQMTAAYVGHLAPSSKLTIVCSLQSADEMRKVQAFSYALALSADSPDIAGAAVKKAWMEDPALQPLRRLMERLLVTYDWGEAFSALNLAVKPHLDLLLAKLQAVCERQGQPHFAQVVNSLLEDSKWHEQWSSHLKQLLIADKPGNAEHLAAWIATWTPLAENAARSVVNDWALEEISK